ncbi:MAG TPA: diguanylate cyclase [Solirubrobacteraceae bacterium]|nr:diguanylate cyclase [Solirubrobacteraceae bacterium]
MESAAAAAIGPDPADVRFRLRNVSAGVFLSVFCCLFYIAYYLLTWSGPHRSALVTMLGVSILGSFGLRAIPMEGLMRRPVAREAFFIGWSVSLIGLILTAMALDGGVDSPLSVALFLPLAFSSLSYPVGSMLAVGALTVATYVGDAAVQGGTSFAHAFFMASTLAIAAWMCAWQARLHASQRQELSRVSRSDPLTDCLNRRGFEERFAAELARASRDGTPLGLVLVDLDDFKQINDSRGHAAGDELLRWTVTALSAHLRPTDALGRLGGDEFALLVPGAGEQHTAALAQRLQSVLSERTPASFGLASFPLDGSDREELHQHADLDLYAVKHGRPAAPGAPGRRRELSWAAALAHAVDLRMAGHHKHSSEVGRHAVAVALRLGWPQERLERLRLAALLHDVGKVAVPEAILRKPGALDEQEMAVMRTHPATGAEMVAQIEGMEDVAEWIRHSHEHVDGSGYPDGVAGDAIPLESRILLVADAFDAMTSNRAYRDAMPAADALAELRRCAGRQFDAHLVEVLAATVEGRPVAARDVA